MRVFPAAAATMLALVSPSLAFAQDTPADPTETALAELSDRLEDPEFQDQAASVAQVLISTLLDLEVGPLAEAIDRATDGKGPDIDPDARLRDLAPDAEELPDQVAERVPEAMAAMGAMTEGMQAMIPAFRDLAEQMRGAMEKARID